jgi:S-disulfanyl-L-cysteine oxidoreductase SoxD
VLTHKLLKSLVVVCSLSGSLAHAEGPFTERQAQRGEALYSRHCAACHGAKLEGGSAAPALSGAIFAQRNSETGGTADDLFFTMRTFMPYDAPGKLSKQDYVDLVAYVLKVNGHLPGSKSLTAETKVLEGIQLAAH